MAHVFVILPPMQLRDFLIAAALSLLAGCAAHSTLAPLQRFDERSGITVTALRAPFELVESGGLSLQKHASFAYLGLLEWDRVGQISQGLWLHVASGNDRQVADITSLAAVTLVLDDGELVLTIMQAPKLGQELYRPLAPWGQTANFAMNSDTFARMARSDKLLLRLRGSDGSNVEFKALSRTRPILMEFARALGLNVD
jgi:hypothetical protein